MQKKCKTWLKSDEWMRKKNCWLHDGGWKYEQLSSDLREDHEQFWVVLEGKWSSVPDGCSRKAGKVVMSSWMVLEGTETIREVVFRSGWLSMEGWACGSAQTMSVEFPASREVLWRLGEIRWTLVTMTVLLGARFWLMWRAMRILEVLFFYLYMRFMSSDCSK